MDGGRRHRGDGGAGMATVKGTASATLLSLLRAKSERTTEAEEKVEWVRSQVVGRCAEFDTPFGRRPLVYADHTASGRSLRYVEDYVLNHVLPFYGNTHTEDSYVGSRTTRMARRAASYIKRCMGAGSGDALLFCGSGATAAVKRLQEAMGVAAPPGPLRERAAALLRPEERWVVFVGPYEHHSNLLSWRRSLADVVEVGAGDDGLLDLAALHRALRDTRYADRPMLGSFSACSNVTGVLTDTRAVARLLHQHGAFACFDFAASGPYVEIDMRSGEMDGYDAVFLSPHKFVGGPGTPGILLMSRSLYRLSSQPPSTCGGGTVAYVNGLSEADTVYHGDVEEREDAGTPPIVGKVRAALAFWVKERVGRGGAVALRERVYADAAMRWLLGNPNLKVLGNVAARRLPIFSFLVFPDSGDGADDDRTTTPRRRGKLRRRLPLHGRFVAKLLNDLFGVQARGGCACAGPYGHALLGVDDDLSLRIRAAIVEGYHGVKPGWTRVSFAYYLSGDEFRYILTAIDFVAAHGHRFLPLYAFDWATGNWSFRRAALKQQLMTHELLHHHLGSSATSSSGYSDDGNEVLQTTKTAADMAAGDVSADMFEGYLESAKRIARSLPDTYDDRREAVSVPEGVDPDIVLFRV
uniref:NifS-like protein n=1 Tax=Oryza meyeriana var. granulata TaxID=110450 RepID=B9V0K9_9ORYZ|nr:NifS-like protein [Oryza meyeriana var. granulata]